MTQLEIAKLPIEEKLQLMESLWDALCHDPSMETAVPAWHADVLADRQVRLDAGKESISDWEEAKKRIREQTEPR